MNMKNFLWKYFLLTLLLPTALSRASEHLHDHNEDPLLSHLMIDQLEVRDGDGVNPVALEGQLWIGKDLNKLWLKTDVERRNSEIKDAELQALYSHAISPFWDAQIGLRRDIKPTPSRSWVVMGVQGLAPYWFDLEAALFVGESGHTAARFSADYDMRFTQKLILSPDIELNFYGQNDIETETGSGLSDLNLGLRLRYEIRREFAPYIGVNWNKKFSNTAKFEKNDAGSSGDTELTIGLRVWF
jgi:copper resistance protein B